MILRLLIVASILLGIALPAMAHESRPAFLEMIEISQGRYDVVWKRPMRGDLVLPLSVVWPEGCATPAPGREIAVPGAVVQRTFVDCGPSGLAGRAIGIDGLREVSADVLVRVEFSDGTTQTGILRPTETVLAIAGPQSTLHTFAEYGNLGFEHILAGVDHLLFVLALVLIVRDKWMLFKTITSFTIAHSITLALATLGVVRVSAAPVEAVIALSIVFLAREIVQTIRGQPGLTARMPWLVAFVFGLLHGLGFAGALHEIGLPQSDIALALFSFNIGVEAGQLAFVSGVLMLALIGRKTLATPRPWNGLVPAYAIGAIAAYWTIDRILLA